MCNCNPCSPSIPDGTQTLISWNVARYYDNATAGWLFIVHRTFTVEGHGSFMEQSSPLTQAQLLTALNAIAPAATWTTVNHGS